ncbi:hypothetical protein ScPMuIL_011557 [Solemya velum]
MMLTRYQETTSTPACNERGNTNFSCWSLENINQRPTPVPDYRTSLSLYIHSSLAADWKMSRLVVWLAVAVFSSALCSGRVLNQQRHGTLELVFALPTLPSAADDNTTSDILDDTNSTSDTNTQPDPPIVADRIINGEQARVSDWPSLTLLQNNGSYLCSGVLVKKNVVLTAAHCVVGLSSPKITAVFGVQNVHDVRAEVAAGTAQEIPVRSIHNYFFYTANPPRNDISVLTLERRIDTSYRISPVKSLRSVPTGYQRESDCFAVGYGVTSPISKRASLRQMEIPLIDNSICMGLIDGVRASNVCGFEQLFGKSGCFGDSGGPLYCMRRDRAVLVGLTSFGYSDCRGPTVFSRISSFKWFLRLFDVNVD